jgi:MraZ protein
MAYFAGEFEQQIDGKHRLSIPHALRSRIDPNADGEEFFLCLTPDWHLRLYPDRYYCRLAEALERTPLPDPDDASLDLWFGMGRFVKPDKQGRIVIPERSLQRSAIEDAVTLVGEMDHIHIWPREAWDRRVEEKLPTYGDMLKRARRQLLRQKAATGETDG